LIISLDTETTGVDFVHGAAPFLVTTCDDEGVIRFWEWDVDPLTRKPEVPAEDVVEIAELIDAADLIYLHNSKFDHRALLAIGLGLPWEKVRDTLFCAHLLASNHQKNLTACCIEYLGVDIEKYELHVEEVVRACRQIVKREHPDWRLAEEGAEGMPSVKSSSKRDEDKPWKNDMWLPRAFARVNGGAGMSWSEGDVKFGHGWLDACSRYSIADAEHTLPLGLEMERLIRERGYWKIYEHRLLLPRVACEMECRGMTAIGDYTEATIAAYEEHAAEAEDALKCIADGYGHDLQLADGSALNDNMRDFFYGAVHQRCPRCNCDIRVKHWNREQAAENAECPKCAKSTKRKAGIKVGMVTTKRDNLALPTIWSEKTGNATLDEDAMEEYLRTTEGPANDFVRILLDKRKHGTDLNYMRSYRRFWVAIPGCPGYYQIHPSLNPCGTDHLRWSSNSPNLQNVSVQEEECEDCDGEGCSLCNGTGKSRLSVRACFGPAPGREGWDLDFRNLEKRIPVYECGEESLIEVFEKPDQPPYWGSDHNVLALLLFPDEYFAGDLHLVKDGFKKKHLVKYKRVKNTNFAKQYSAGKRKVDATAGVAGAYEKIERGLPRIAELQARTLMLAQRTGWVETLPDRTVDPTRGYRILASRTDDGRVLSTTPFNYKVSGTACWVKNTAAIRCADQCRQWRREGFDAWMALEVHDSLYFDFPRGRTPEENKPRAMVLKSLMEQSGADLIPAIPTPVSVEYVSESWAKGVGV
jgi:hypothetical protein